LSADFATIAEGFLLGMWLPTGLEGVAWHRADRSDTMPENGAENARERAFVAAAAPPGSSATASL